MEFDIENFQVEYDLFQNNLESLEINVVDGDDVHELSRLNEVLTEYNALDIKLRLAFGIREIILNNEFVSDKENDLKSCHLLYYKLADLWFAYETYIKFYVKIMRLTKHKILWIGSETHEEYALSISTAQQIVYHKLSENFSDDLRRELLIEYLSYCIMSSSKSQQKLLESAVDKVQQSSFDLSNREILSIVYAVRNNFVHNGETTVVPDIFGYSNKSILLSILYEYLSIIILKSTNITYGKL